MNPKWKLVVLFLPLAVALLARERKAVLRGAEGGA